MKECLIISKDDTHEQTNAWCVELPEAIFAHINEGHSISGNGSDVLTDVLEIMVERNMINTSDIRKAIEKYV